MSGVPKFRGGIRHVSKDLHSQEAPSSKKANPTVKKSAFPRHTPAAKEHEKTQSFFTKILNFFRHRQEPGEPKTSWWKKLTGFFSSRKETEESAKARLEAKIKDFSVDKKLLCIQKFTDFLSQDLNHEGMFRVPGSSEVIKGLIRREAEQDPKNISEGDKLDPKVQVNPQSPVITVETNDVASAMKQFVRACDVLAAKMGGKQTIGKELLDLSQVNIKHVKQIIDRLPPDNRKLLHSIVKFLNNVSKYSDKNKMAASNLAICFAPNFFPNAALSQAKATADIVTLLIEKVDDIFPDLVENAEPAAEEQVLQPAAFEADWNPFGEASPQEVGAGAEVQVPSREGDDWNPFDNPLYAPPQGVGVGNIEEDNVFDLLDSQQAESRKTPDKSEPMPVESQTSTPSEEVQAPSKEAALKEPTKTSKTEKKKRQSAMFKRQKHVKIHLPKPPPPDSSQPQEKP